MVPFCRFPQLSNLNDLESLWDLPGGFIIIYLRLDLVIHQMTLFLSFTPVLTWISDDCLLGDFFFWFITCKNTNKCSDWDKHNGLKWKYLSLTQQTRCWKIFLDHITIWKFCGAYSKKKCDSFLVISPLKYYAINSMTFLFIKPFYADLHL